MEHFVNSIYTAQEAKGEGSKAKKREAIEGWSDVGKRLAMECMSPYRVFGIKKLVLPKQYSETDADVEEFFTLLDKLHDRELTGHAARDEVTRVLGLYTKRTAEIFRRVILGNLKGGFSAETVNEVHCGKKKPHFDDAVVPVYGCMLAEKMPKKTDKKQFEWFFPMIIEAKYDGQRTNSFIYNKKNVIEHKARSGKMMDHIDSLFDDELMELAGWFKNSMVFDGETMGSDFTETMNAKSSDNDHAKANLKLFLYDYVPMCDWIHQNGSGIIQLDRTKKLEQAIADVGCTKIIKSKWKVIHSIEEAQDFYEECLEDGYEGCVLKDPNGVYEWERSKYWTKWKPVEDYDVQITGFYPGRPETRLQNTLGGVYAEGVDENGTFVKCSVGSGFSDKERDEIWNNQDEYLGKMIQVEADPQLSESKGEYSLRWPIFIKFRPDKDVL